MESRNCILCKATFGAVFLSLFLTVFCSVLVASEVVNIPILADAIFKAEGVNSRHPYGILKKYKTTTPRQACINTIKSALKRYQTDSKGLEFIPFLAKTYCPVGAKNDPTGLNKNWVKNVTYFYQELSVKSKGSYSSLQSIKHKL